MANSDNHDGSDIRRGCAAKQPGSAVNPVGNVQIFRSRRYALRWSGSGPNQAASFGARRPPGGVVVRNERRPEGHTDPPYSTPDPFHGSVSRLSLSWS